MGELGYLLAPVPPELLGNLRNEIYDFSFRANLPSWSNCSS